MTVSFQINQLTYEVFFVAKNAFFVVVIDIRKVNTSYNTLSINIVDVVR
jgi:hypothetical protein